MNISQKNINSACKLLANLIFQFLKKILNLVYLFVLQGFISSPRQGSNLRPAD